MQTTHTFGETTRPVTWIDVVDPTTEELDALADQYGLSQRTFDEAHRRAARPTMHRFDDHVYIVAFTGSLVEIDMYLGPNWLITVRRSRRRWPEMGSATDARPVRAPRRRTKTSGHLFATLLDGLVDGYFDTTDVLEDKLEVVEDNIFNDTPTHRAGACSTTCSSCDASCWNCAVLWFRCGRCCRRSCAKRSQYIDGEALVTVHDAFDKLLRGRRSGRRAARARRQRGRCPSRRDEQPDEPGDEEAHGVGLDRVRGDVDRRHLRHELRPHARARLAVRVPDGARR